MALRPSFLISSFACCALSSAAPFEAVRADDCSQSPISIDAAPFNEQTMELSCEPAETVSPAEFDEAAKAMVGMAPFFRAFFPPAATVYKAGIGGNGLHYIQAFLIDAKGEMSLSRADLRAALEAIAKNDLLSERPGTVTWGKAVQLSDYHVEFYIQELPKDMIGGGRSDCLSFVRCFDGTSNAHHRRILGYYCRDPALGQTDEDLAKKVIATLQYRPERVK